MPELHVLDWRPLSAVFISLVIIDPFGYLFTKKMLSPQRVILLFIMLVAAANITAIYPTLWLLSLMGLPLQGATNPMAFQTMVVPLVGTLHPGLLFPWHRPSCYGKEKMDRYGTLKVPFVYTGARNGI
jgi:hypothetical protein